jgi:hypothetical protein
MGIVAGEKNLSFLCCSRSSSPSITTVPLRDGGAAQERMCSVVASWRVKKWRGGWDDAAINATDCQICLSATVRLAAGV